MRYPSFSSNQKLFLLGFFSFIYINLAQAQVPLYGTITGGNAINVNVPGNYGGTYYTGHSFIFLAVGSVSSGPVTISVNGAATRIIKKNVNQDLVSGDILNGQAVPVIYDGTNFQIVKGDNSIAGTASGISTLNNLTSTSQIFNTSSTGSSININSSGSVHNFNIPLVTVVGGNNVTVSGGFPNYTISGAGIPTTATTQWVSTGTGTIFYSSAGNSERVVIGTPIQATPFWKTTIIGQDQGNLLSLFNHSAVSNIGGIINLSRANGSPGSYTPLVTGNQIGAIQFAGSLSGNQTNYAAGIHSYASNNWSNTSTPTRLDFYITPTNATVTSLAMTLNDAGYLGIGTTPSAKLDVNGDARFLGPVSITGLAGASTRALGVNNLGQLVTIAGSGSANNWSNSGSNSVHTTGGFVGINALNPLSRLEVRGNNSSTSVSGAEETVRIGSTDNTALRLGIWMQTDPVVNNQYMSINAISAGNRNLLLQSTGGNVGIGTALPNEKLLVQGNTSVTGIGYFGSLQVKNLIGPGTVTVDGLGNLGVTTAAGSALSGSGTANGVAFWRNGTTLTVDGANFTYTSSTKSLKVGNAILSSNSSSGNVFFGTNVGNQTMSGTDNNFFGTNIGQSITSGKNNNFFGKAAGSSNVLGESNNYLGEEAGYSNQIGSYNNAMGYQAGYGNVSETGSNNNSFGQGSGFENEGDGNNFMGFFAGRGNTSGNYNNFFGQSAGLVNTTGNDNIFIGQMSGLNNSTGDNNIAIGKNAGFPVNGFNNSVAIGINATVGGSNLMALGGSGVDAVNVGIGTGLPQNTIDVVGGARIRNLSVSGAVFANASGDLYISTVAGASSNLWTISGSNLQPTSTYGVNLTSTLASYMIAGSDVVRIIPATNGNNILLGGAGNPTISSSGNVLVGQNAGSAISSGNNNTFVGDYSGTANNTGGFNTFYGFRSGASNNSGNSNTFIGYFSGNQNTSGGQNTFMGLSAGNNNSIGSANTFIGNSSGALNNTGGSNAFVGQGSGNNNTSGNNNAFHGFRAGFLNSVASGNSFLGSYAGHNSTGANNTAIGYQADITGAFTYAVALGAGASVNGSNMMALGGAAGSGYQVSVGIGTGIPQNTIDVVGGARIRNLSVSGAVFATSNGDLYINTTSSANLWTVSGTALTPSNSSYGVNVGTNVTTTGLVNISSTTNSGLVVSSYNLPANTGAIVGNTYVSSTAGVAGFVNVASAVGVYGQSSNSLSVGLEGNNSAGGTAIRASGSGSVNPLMTIDQTGLTGIGLRINLSSASNTATGLLITSNSSSTQALDIVGKVQLRNYTNGTLTVDGLGNLGVSTSASSVGAGAGFMAASTSIQTISAAGWNNVQFQLEQFDDATAYDNSVTYDYTAPSSGVYQVNANVPFANIGQVDIAITIVGSGNIIVNSVSTSPTTGVITSVPVSGIIKLTANQKVSIRVRQFTGQTQSTASSASGANASFSMVKLY